MSLVLALNFETWYCFGFFSDIYVLAYEICFSLVNIVEIESIVRIVKIFITSVIKLYQIIVAFCKDKQVYVKYY